MVHNRLKLQCQGHLGPLASMDSCPHVVIPNIHINRNHTNKYFKRETLRIPCAWVRCELSPLSDKQSLPKGGVVRHVFSTRSWEHHLENFQPKDTILSKHLSLGNQNVPEVRWEDLLLSRIWGTAGWMLLQKAAEPEVLGKYYLSRLYNRLGMVLVHHNSRGNPKQSPLWWRTTRKKFLSFLCIALYEISTTVIPYYSWGGRVVSHVVHDLVRDTIKTGPQAGKGRALEICVQ